MVTAKDGVSRETLAELAACHGVAVEYWDQSGAHVRVESEVVVEVLAALAVDASTEESARAAVHAWRLRGWRRTLPPVFVQREDREGRCWVHVPQGTGVVLRVVLDDGTAGPVLEQVHHHAAAVEVDGRQVGEAMFRVPAGLPTGWHTLRAEPEQAPAADCPLVVTPAHLPAPERGWGLAAQLYSLRSSRSWGLGDLADLADLARWAAFDHGADFVLVNPLHAAAPTSPMEPSPYLPVTRRFGNPVYVRVEEVPEFAYLPAPERERVEELANGPRAANLTAELLDRDATWHAKRAALELVHRVPRMPGREAAYRVYREREGQGLADFATWCALVEVHGPMTGWPPTWQDPRSGAVEVERARLADRVEFHVWCQWVLDDQLATAQEAACGAGMRIGVVHDLAVGVHPEGADVWTYGDVLAHGVSVGAPPDMYNQRGQNWSQPPWRPDALAEAAFLPYRDMLRTVLRHAGALRVDHVLGLFRLWWVPQGRPADQGTYVRYDHEALLGILVLEAQRAGAVVIGEDLGTVEGWVQETLRDRGVLGTSLLWFERRGDGSVPPPEQWRADVLASVTTHDLPPSLGYLGGAHVELRHRLGLLSRPVADERADHAAEVAAWRSALVTEGLLRPEAPFDELVRALHTWLRRTPARLVAVSLADAVGESRAQNQPGTHHEYPNWQVPLSDHEGRPVLLEQLPDLRGVQDLLRALDPG